MSRGIVNTNTNELYACPDGLPKSVLHLRLNIIELVPYDVVFNHIWSRLVINQFDQLIERWIWETQNHI